MVHLHRVGSCQGHLVVSRDGIAFVPDDKENRDNKPILNALEALSSKGTPVDEKTLLSELKKMIPSKDWNDGIEKKLELWKTTILAYTRIP